MQISLMLLLTQELTATPMLGPISTPSGAYQNGVALHFMDFGIMALLFAILYAISTFEHAQLEHKGKWPKDGLRLNDFKIAATVAFVGICLCIALGLTIPHLGNEIPYADYSVAIPFGLSLVWALYQRRASRMIDFNLLADELDYKYSGIILKVAQEHTELSDDDLYRETVMRAQTYGDGLLKDTERLIGRRQLIIPLGAALALTESFLLSRERFDRLLGELRDKKSLPPPKARPIDALRSPTAAVPGAPATI